MFEIVSRRELTNSPVYQARLSGVPLGDWHPRKQDAVQDILRCGLRGDVADRTGVEPFVSERSLGWSS